MHRLGLTDLKSNTAIGSRWLAPESSLKRHSTESGELKNNITGDLFVVSVPGLSKKYKEWLVLSTRHS